MKNEQLKRLRQLESEAFVNGMDRAEVSERIDQIICEFEESFFPTGRNQYVLLIESTDDDGITRWVDSGEGPWPDRETAIQWGKCECGSRWMVALIDAADCGATVGELASRNVCDPRILKQ